MAVSFRAVPAVLALVSASLRAQSALVVLPEVRLDAIVARATTTQLGVGWSAGGSGYNRAALAIGAGTAWKDGQTSASARVDATMRFLLDPYRASRWGLYGLGGLGVLYDDFSDWRALLLMGVGLEFPSRHGSEWAAEFGLGGGIRLGIAWRRLHPDRR